jgi:nitroreductase
MMSPSLTLYEMMQKRVSRRSFDGKPITNEDYDELTTLVEIIAKEEPDLRLELHKEGAERIFAGRMGYGVVNGCTSYVAFIGKEGKPNVEAKIGYYGELLILTATRLGLATCWIAGTFNRKSAVEELVLQSQETLFCVSPLGDAKKEKTVIEKTMGMLVGSRKRKEMNEIFIGDLNKIPEYARVGLESARIAPSGVNHQPWLFEWKNEKMLCRISEKFKGKGSSAIDCGIAMLHFALGALKVGIKGEWRFLNDPLFAEFIIVKSK